MSRYNSLDAYSSEELRRQFLATDSCGKLRLLKRFYRGYDNRPPFELAKLAAEDQDAQVRAWIAKNGKYLDYTDRLFRTPGPSDSQLNLVPLLLNDPDPFVRACLRENPTVFDGLSRDDWLRYFKTGGELERFALVRNPAVHREFIEKLFDPDDSTLGIAEAERKELAMAFLTNQGAISKVQDDSHPETHDLMDFSYRSGSARRFTDSLWASATKWPRESGVGYAVYRYIPVSDDARANLYNASHNTGAKFAIVEGCDPGDIKTLTLALEDTDELCRGAAAEKIGSPDGILVQALERGDKDILDGLARNRTLSISQLEQVRDRLVDLNNYLGADAAERTIAQLDGRSR